MNCCEVSRRIVLLFLTAGCVLSAAKAETGPNLRSGKFSVSQSDRSYWAFQPVVRPSIPPLTNHAPVANAIDAFVVAKLSEKNLRMNPSATPRELARRASFDLLGLPPTPEDVAAFEQDSSEEAWGRLIDRLLASPHYGERWGRHWLDLVRYAESNGYERDGPKPHAWRYRDYVIRSFNRDKPYDQFVREQLAGDEIAEDLLRRGESGEWREAIIATGFYRLHVWDDEPDSTVVAEYDDLDDIMVATSTAFLGLTVGCARCHDHKFDPISQADYYSMLSFFRSIDPYGLHKTGGGGRGTGKIERALARPADVQRWEREKQERINALQVSIAASIDSGAQKRLKAELKKAQDAPAPFEFALAVAENGARAKPTHILARGDAHSPRAEVSPAFLSVLGTSPPSFSARNPDAPSTGRRRVLGDWIASAHNPLTARVIVNRLWQRHFGVGVVPTPDDFGQTGLPPTNLPLLDYLAAEFIAGGWSLKRMHKLIMTSRAYRMSSSIDYPEAQSVDESNVSLWRQNLRRTEAEVIRDTMLAVTGLLNAKQHGPSVFPTLPKAVHNLQDSSGKGWADSPPAEQNRRSIYLVVKRALKVPLLECLDFANSASPVGARPVTTTAPQALMLLNDSLVQGLASAFADRLLREVGPNEEPQIRRAFQLVLQRAPTTLEVAAARKLIEEQREQAAAEHKSQPARVALESFCRAVLNLNETIYVD